MKIINKTHHKYRTKKKKKRRIMLSFIKMKAKNEENFKYEENKIAKKRKNQKIKNAFETAEMETDKQWEQTNIDKSNIKCKNLNCFQKLSKYY